MASENDEPLATVVERVWGKPEHEQYYTRAYFNWVHMLYMVDPRQGNFSQTKCDQLVAAMSETQLSSLNILEEWWSGAIQERKLSEAIRDNILSAAMAPLLDDVDLAAFEDKDSAKEHIRRVAKDECLTFDPQVEESSYHQALLLLWQSEFCVGPYGRDYNLGPARRSATIVACNQRIAWSVFEEALAGSETLLPSVAQSNRKLAFPRRATLAVCPWLGQKQKKAAMGPTDGLPYYLWDVKGKRTIETSTLTSGGTRPRYLTISHTWGRWRCREPPAVIDGVPWPVPLISRFDVRNLPHEMKDKAFSSSPYVWIDLFCIPQNTAGADLLKIKDAEIARQGEIFSNASGAVIWLNDIEDWRGLEMAVLWFAATFLKQSRSQSKDGAPSMEPWLPLLEKEANENSTGLLGEYEYTGRMSMRSASPCGWFSSLWTLQEACLRPDILLVDRNWRLFAVGPKNLIVTLDNLLAIVHGFEVHKELMKSAVITTEEFEDIPSGKIDIRIPATKIRDLLRKIEALPDEEAFILPDMPRAAAELHHILNRFEMTQILDARPLTILALANQRYCRHSRAQAIMSVLGATKWFNRHLEEHGTSPPEDSLVLGTFPLDFVREVQGQLGVQFFRSAGSGFDVCPKEILKRDPARGSLTINPVGSMLPFSSSAERPKRITSSDCTDTATGHPSVLSWTILEDGTVRIAQAAIFTYHQPDVPNLQTAQTSISRLRARVTIHTCQKGVPIQDVVLSDFFKEYSPHFCIYAVLLSHGTFSRNFSGIILQEIVKPHGYAHPFVQKRLTGIQGYEFPTKVLVRVGIWTLWDVQETSENDVPQVRDVDWRVL